MGTSLRTTDYSAIDELGENPPVSIPPETLTPTLPNGFHTLTLPDGSHRTFRVYRKRDGAKFAPGKRIISLLIGPDNTNDYEDFGFVSEMQIAVWKRFRGHKQEEYAAIIWRIAQGEVVEGYELLTDRRCLICNRTLTEPESIERGIGPLCWDRLQGNI